MTRVLVLVTAAVALTLAGPASARADVLLTPYAGVNFGGGTIDTRVNVGAALAWIGSRGLGVEVDFGFVPDFFEPKDTTIVYPTNHVATLMGNVVLTRSGGAIQPYLVAGAGLLRSNVGSFGDFFDDVTTENSLGINGGAGVRVGGGRFSVSADARYFRALSDVPIALQDVLADFSFWRASAGLTFKF